MAIRETSRGTKKNNRRGHYRVAYVEGSAARALWEEEVWRKRQEREEKLNVRRRRYIDKAGYMTLGHVLLLAVIIISATMMCAKYVNLRSELTQRQRVVSQAEHSLNELKLANDEEYARIMGSVDLETIKSIAMNELGMTYPNSEQVVGFENNDSDFVRQYGDMPH